MTGTGSTKRYIFGVKIYIDGEFTDPDIGLYTSGGVSWFRWFQTYTSNTTDTWKEGIIIKNGLGGISQSSDFRRGGNLAKVKGTSIAITNVISDGSKIWEKLEDAGISLNGLRAEIIEIDNDTAHGGTNANETIIFRGICETPSGWTRTTFSIPIKNSYYKRRANLATIIDNQTNGNYPYAEDSSVGQIVPISFGKFEKASFIRTTKKNIVYANTDLISPSDAILPQNQTVFPVISDQTVPVLDYYIQLGNDKTDTLTGISLIDKYVYVVEGAGKGQYRRITNSIWYPEILKYWFTISDYFTETLQGNATATKAEQSWVQIIDLSQDFQGDVWPCDGFVDSSGNEITENLETYAFGEDPKTLVSGTVKVTGGAETVNINGDNVPLNDKPRNYIKLPEVSFDAVDDSNYNKISAKIDQFNSGIDRLKSFLILPIKNIELETEFDVNTKWGVGYSPVSGKPGLYYGDYPYPTYSPPTQNAINDLIDKLRNTSASFLAITNSSSGLAIILTFELPNYPDYFDFDNVYFGIRAQMGTKPNNENLQIKWRRFLGDSQNINNSFPLLGDDNYYKNIENLPDKYYNPEANTNDAFFYLGRNGSTNKVMCSNFVGTPFADNEDLSFSPSGATGELLETDNSSYLIYNLTSGIPTTSDVITGGSSSAHCDIDSFFHQEEVNHFSGYTQFKIDNISNKDLYNSIHQLAIILSGDFPSYGGSLQLDIYELAIIFEKEISLKNKIYLPFKGRIYNDTWGNQTTFGDSTSRFDIAHYDYDGGVNNYIYDGVGTSMDFAAEGLEVGDRITIDSDNFLENNNGVFEVITVTDVNFIVKNPDGENQTDVTLENNDALIGDKFLQLLENPIEIIEHILRLQNWSETGDNVNWGKEYSDNALINTGSASEGQFSYPELDIIKEYDCSHQITNYGHSWTDSLMKSLCAQYFLCNYQDENGKENITFIGKSKIEPTVSIGLDDIIEDSIGQVTEMEQADIFVEPFIRYDKNYATGEYNKVIRITNSNADTFNSSYVSGYTGDEAERLWDLCHTLWNYYKVIEEPPSQLTDCEWIRTDEDAERYLFQWIRWMGAFKPEGEDIIVSPLKWISFSVPYNIATDINGTHKAWYVSMHFNLTLPHQTKNEELQCIIESISFDINNYVAKVTAIILESTITSAAEIDYYIENSYDSYSSIGWEDWENTYYTKAEQPTNSYDVEAET